MPVAHIRRRRFPRGNSASQREGGARTPSCTARGSAEEDAPFTCVCLPRVRCPRYVPTASRVRARAAESTKKMMNEGGIEQPGVAKETEITDYIDVSIHS